MRKGRFGLVLCAYPIVAFVGVILNQPIVCALVFGVALLAERDEWTGRQTLQALALSVITYVFRWIVGFVITRMDVNFILAALGAASAIIYLLAIVASILGILRVMRGREADLPLLSDLSYRAYGKRKPQPQPFPGQYPPPFQQPGQPVPPSYQPGQPPYPQAAPGASQAPHTPVPPQGPVPPNPQPPVPPVSPASPAQPGSPVPPTAPVPPQEPGSPNA